MNTLLNAVKSPLFYAPLIIAFLVGLLLPGVGIFIPLIFFIPFGFTSIYKNNRKNEK